MNWHLWSQEDQILGPKVLTPQNTDLEWVSIVTLDIWARLSRRKIWSLISKKLKPDETEIGWGNVKAFSPKQLFKELMFGIKSSCAPSLNCARKSVLPKFRFGAGWSEELKILSPSGLGSWLEDHWITFALRNTLEFLFPWRSVSWIGCRNRFWCSSRFPISQLSLNAGSSVATAF